MRLATCCRDTWVRRLWTRPAHGRRWVTVSSWTTPPPHHPEGGPPLLPYARMPPPPPPGAPPSSVLLAVPQRSRPPGAGSGTWGTLCLEHGAPSGPRCKSLGSRISRYCRARHEGHGGSAAGPWCPAAMPRVAPGRQVLVPQDRRVGALSSWLGRARPALAFSDAGPPAARRCAVLPKTLGARPPLALGPGSPRPPKRPKPDLVTD